MADHKLDTVGLKCPMPVLKTKKMIKKMNLGEILEVIADDQGAKSDIPALLSKIGSTLEELKEEDGLLTFIIRKD
ncbi:MAG: sulfurtransferase TusA family protein [Candidatus Hodarchaeales archaeon]